MPDQPQPRTLSFNDLDEVLTDVRALHAAGYTAVGNWDLAQACGHLNDWMRFPMDGFPRAPLAMRMMLGLLRITMGRRMLRKILADGSMKRGAPTMPETVPEHGGDQDAAVKQLCATIERWQSFDGPYHTSPLFGDMDRETATRLQLIHCAHHLSLLLPK